jgi:hypothetical protein
VVVGEEEEEEEVEEGRLNPRISSPLGSAGGLFDQEPGLDLPLREVRKGNYYGFGILE